jgi:RHS repeat-associated protein
MAASITRPGNVATTYGYDGADRLTSVHHDVGTSTIAHYDYVLDQNGNRASMTSAAGAENYTLDALNRLTAATYPNGDKTAYTYDAAGNRLTSTLNGTATNYTYDTAGRLVSQGAKTISYDGASNITANGSDTYSWDWAGRMASSTVGGAIANYTYDGDGVRTAVTNVGSTTNYVWDRASSLPLLVDDGTQGYVQTERGVLEQLGSTASYPLGDALGSVRTLETPTPSALGTTSYDAFGSVRSQSGQQSIFGFTGQQTDPTGLSFLRARYYNSSLGRFTSPDSVQPNAPGTQGYNLYAYVANNATTDTDPAGTTNALFTALSSLTWRQVLGLVGYGARAALGRVVAALFSRVGLTYLVGGAVASALGAAIGAWSGAVLIPSLTAPPQAPSAAQTGAPAVPALLSVAAVLAASKADVAAGRQAQPREIVYRVWGGTSQEMGRFWSPFDPRTLPNPRDLLGLPRSNTGQYLTTAEILNPAGIIVRIAAPLDGTNGGALEFFIPFPNSQLRVISRTPLTPPI